MFLELHKKVGTFLELSNGSCFYKPQLEWVTESMGWSIQIMPHLGDYVRLGLLGEFFQIIIDKIVVKFQLLFLRGYIWCKSILIRFWAEILFMIMRSTTIYFMWLEILAPHLKWLKRVAKQSLSVIFPLNIWLISKCVPKKLWSDWASIP